MYIDKGHDDISYKSEILNLSARNLKYSFFQFFIFVTLDLNQAATYNFIEEHLNKPTQRNNVNEVNYNRIFNLDINFQTCINSIISVRRSRNLQN